MLYYCPDVFFLILCINVLGKQVNLFLWFGLVAVIDFLIDQKLQPCWGEGGGGSSDIFNMFIQIVVNNIGLARCSIEKLHFNLGIRGYVNT